MSYKVSRGGLLTALSFIILLSSSVFTTLTLSLSAIAGCVVGIAAIELSQRDAWVVFFAVAVLSWMLLPRREVVFSFCGFFGYYPIVRSYIMSFKSIWTRLLLKLIIFNIAIAFLVFAASVFVISDVNINNIMIIALWIISNVIFLIYDKGLERLLMFYSFRIGGRR